MRIADTVATPRQAERLAFLWTLEAEGYARVAKEMARKSRKWRFIDLNVFLSLLSGGGLEFGVSLLFHDNAFVAFVWSK